MLLFMTCFGSSWTHLQLLKQSKSLLHTIHKLTFCTKHIKTEIINESQREQTDNKYMTVTCFLYMYNFIYTYIPWRHRDN